MSLSRRLRGRNYGIFENVNVYLARLRIRDELGFDGVEVEKCTKRFGTDLPFLQVAKSGRQTRKNTQNPQVTHKIRGACGEKASSRCCLGFW